MRIELPGGWSAGSWRQPVRRVDVEANNLLSFLCIQCAAEGVICNVGTFVTSSSRFFHVLSRRRDPLLVVAVFPVAAACVLP